MVKQYTGSRAVQIIIVLCVIILAATGLYFLSNTSRTSKTTTTTTTTNGVSESGFTTIAGKVTAVDLSGMQTDRDGIYQITGTSDETYTIMLTSGKSTCDRDAISIPKDVSEGTNVEVRAKDTGDNTLRICEAGTYIRVL